MQPIRFTTTIMSGPLTWVSSFKDTEVRAALNAGWKRSDLLWEFLQESANRDLVSFRRTRSILWFLLAYLLGWVCMAHSDPRRATGLANIAFAMRMLGAELLARRTFVAAEKRWASVGVSLNTIEIAPRARSSLFHMRMEAIHWETYQANTKARLGKFIAETGENIRCLAAGDPVPHRLYSRWVGEKPPVFDDTRKILGACLLVAAKAATADST